VRTRSIARPPGRPKQSDNLDVSQDILKVAAKLFMDSGYDAVSIEMIAESVGVTKASIYYYFSSKSDLFVSAIETLLDRIQQETARILKQPHPLKARLLDLTKVRLGVPETRFDFERLIQEAEPQLDADQHGRLLKSMHNMAQILVEAFHEAILHHEIKPIDPTFATHAFFSLFSVAYAKNDDGDRLFPNPSVTADALVNLLFSGLSVTAE